MLPTFWTLCHSSERRNIISVPRGKFWRSGEFSSLTFSHAKLYFNEKNSFKVYAYRGIQGFVQISNFNLPRTANKMEHVQLPQEIDDVHQCSTSFLCVTTDTDLIFYQAKTEPEKHCEIKTNLKCD